jgi:hypothetical protein
MMLLVDRPSEMIGVVLAGAVGVVVLVAPCMGARRGGCVGASGWTCRGACGGAVDDRRSGGLPGIARRWLGWPPTMRFGIRSRVPGGRLVNDDGGDRVVHGRGQLSPSPSPDRPPRAATAPPTRCPSQVDETRVQPARGGVDTTQSGTQTESCTDTSGCGLDVGWIANGDWLRYNGIDFGTGGTSV